MINSQKQVYFTDEKIADKNCRIVYYPSSKVKLNQIGEDIWLTQNQIAELFDTTQQNVSLHIQNILKSGELEENRTHKDFLLVQNESGRKVSRYVTHYNLDMIISVGYKVNSAKGTAFRKWATQVLKEHLKQQYSRQCASNLNRITINEFMKKRTSRIKKELKLKGITQTQIAKELGYSKTHICGVLNGVRYGTPLIEKEVVKKNLKIDNHAPLRAAKDSLTTNYYNLDVIISVGYRVNSKRGIAFRQWATKVIKERMLQQWQGANEKLSEMQEKMKYISEQINNQNYLIYKLEEKHLQLENKNRHNVAVLRDFHQAIYSDINTDSRLLDRLETRVLKLERKLAHAKRKTVTVLTA